MKKAILTASAAAFALAALAGYAAARDQILEIVGSSTVFPFTTAVAEKLGQGGQFKTPVVELTGTGGGMKLFCSGVGETTPDFTNASRAIKDSELADCKANGATPVEIKIGSFPSSHSSSSSWLLSLARHLSIASQHLVPSHLVSIRVFDVEPAYHVSCFFASGEKPCD